MMKDPLTREYKRKRGEDSWGLEKLESENMRGMRGILLGTKRATWSKGKALNHIW